MRNVIPRNPYTVVVLLRQRVPDVRKTMLCLSTPGEIYTATCPGAKYSVSSPRTGNQQRTPEGTDKTGVDLHPGEVMASLLEMCLLLRAILH